MPTLFHWIGGTLRRAGFAHSYLRGSGRPQTSRLFAHRRVGREDGVKGGGAARPVSKPFGLDSIFGGRVSCVARMHHKVAQIFNGIDSHPAGSKQTAIPCYH